MKPITPKEAREKQLKDIPPYVIDAVNSLIVEKLFGKRAIITKKSIIEKIIDKSIFLTEEQIYKRGYLNFEPIFEEVGWKVIYMKPDWSDTWEPYFEFTEKG